MLLHLNNKHKSDIPFDRFVFPDGQDHIKIKYAPLDVEVDIVNRIANASDLFVLLQTVEVLRNNYGVKSINLTVPYLLAARMDRRMNPGEPISLKVVANVINSLGLNRVKVFDPHSDVSITLIDRSEAITNYDFISGVLQHLPPVKLIVPDAGAAKKSGELAKRFNLETVHCSKVRSTIDGYISQVKVEGDNIGDCLIVDDICDGGATFVNLARALKEKGARNMYLAVSHGIFSKGLEPLADFTHIFTTNSYKEQPHNEILTTYNLW